MKNLKLEVLGVQEMNAIEMLNGGGVLLRTLFEGFKGVAEAQYAVIVAVDKGLESILPYPLRQKNK